jgi:hypothetical protein
MTPFEYAMLAVIAVFVALILLGVFRPPKVLREEAEDMLAYVRHALYDYELPEDRLVIARLTSASWRSGRVGLRLICDEVKVRPRFNHYNGPR